MGPARTTRTLLALSVALATGLLAPPAATATITEFPLPRADRSPFAITAGPDGALWFTELGNGLGAGNAAIGRITTGGTVTEFPIPTSSANPYGITRGPDGALWFTEGLVPQIGRVTTGGGFSEFAAPAGGSRLLGITAGPDGALWFTAEGLIGRITTAGAVTFFPAGGDAQSDIVAGPDGALWFTEQSANRIGRITTAGSVTHFPVPTPGAVPNGITAGPDGALWFTEFGANRIGRITTAGGITEFEIRTPGSDPLAITAGPDGALWFTEFGANKIGRITTSGTITDFRIPSVARDIAAGSDGALWFTEEIAGRIGRITTDHPREDSVDGTLYVAAPCDPPQCISQPSYTFRVSSGPAGENPLGTVTYRQGERLGLTIQTGSATCLRVEGNRAAIGVEFPRVEFPLPLPARGALIVVEDNGPVGADRFAVQDVPAGTAPSSCPSPAGVALGPAFPPAPGATGPGVVVTDVAPVSNAPTSKEQCKHGGWRRFGFRNQGQCIAFVNHGGKPPKP
jgi:virginiamycin B lyase